MATKKISQLTLATGVTGADVLAIVQGGVTKRATISSFRANVVVTPTKLTANTTVTGYSPGSGDIFRLAVSGSTGVVVRNMGITGIDGETKLLINVGATAPITLNHATGPNLNAQFAVPSGSDYALSPNGGAARIVYDATSQVWRVV
ncbi:MAG: hypothetical protein EBR82_47605 [Caulobacteraceae bacterium]|nr:hypothetical protein [Caulobacteraceae bacterium]